LEKRLRRQTKWRPPEKPFLLPLQKLKLALQKLQQMQNKAKTSRR
jgi:hypothetical protein